VIGLGIMSYEALIQEWGPGFEASRFKYTDGCEKRKGCVGRLDVATGVYHATSVETLPIVLASVPESTFTRTKGDNCYRWVDYEVDGSSSGVQRVFVVRTDGRVDNFPFPY
jgi:hypothetical protein